MGVAFDREGESGFIGYGVAERARRRGIATRATRLLVGWAFDALGLERVELLAEVDNVASQRVAENLASSVRVCSGPR